jgi:hypothetical protein
VVRTSNSAVLLTARVTMDNREMPQAG